MEFPDQNQHKIPQVYLKKFGYVTPNNQRKVSVLKRGESFTRQKSIGRFASAINIFDINSHDPRIQRLFEKLNGDLETEYNNIVSELERDGKITLKSRSYLTMLIANLIVRSDHWRSDILSLLESDVRIKFLKVILGHHCKDEVEFENIHQQEYFRAVAELPGSESINRVLIYFLDHLLLRLEHYQITFIQSRKQKPWITTTDPVVVHNRTSKFEILDKESEIYFPLTPQFLVYMHYKESSDQDNILRKYKSNIVTVASEEQNSKLQDIILSQEFDYMIFPEFVEIDYQGNHEEKKIPKTPNAGK